MYCKIMLGDYMKNLKIIRRKKGLTQQEVAKAINLSSNTYSRYERGYTKIDPDSLVALSKYFNVSTDYLLGLIEVPFTSEEVKFMGKNQNENDYNEISEDFDVYIGDQLVTGRELLRLMEKMKRLDKVVNGGFFKHKKDTR